MTTKIKLMPDYCCYPLWGIDVDNIGNINPATLPLSQDTIKRLEKWANIYDATLNWNDPASSGFPDDHSESIFEEEGISLWYQLREELYPDYAVYYLSDRHPILLTTPAELNLYL